MASCQCQFCIFYYGQWQPRKLEVEHIDPTELCQEHKMVEPYFTNVRNVQNSCPDSSRQVRIEPVVQNMKHKLCHHYFTNTKDINNFDEPGNVHDSSPDSSRQMAKDSVVQNMERKLCKHYEFNIPRELLRNRSNDNKNWRARPQPNAQADKEEIHVYENQTVQVTERDKSMNTRSAAQLKTSENVAGAKNNVQPKGKAPQEIQVKDIEKANEPNKVFKTSQERKDKFVKGKIPKKLQCNDARKNDKPCGEKPKMSFKKIQSRRGAQCYLADLLKKK